VLSLLNTKVKTSLPLFINEEYRDRFDEALKMMSDNLEQFNEQKKDLIEELLRVKDLLITKASMVEVDRYGLLSQKILLALSKSFLEIVFKAVKSPEKPSEGEKKVDDQQTTEQILNSSLKVGWLKEKFK
jgi:hypothetical protein